MNKFYDISENQALPDDGPQLRNLGDKKILASFAKPSRNDWGGRAYTTSNIYGEIKSEDYDEFFASRIARIRPPYEMDKFVEHHYQHYIKRYPDGKSTFLKHMKFVIIPILEKRKRPVYIDLLKEWLEGKKSVLPVPHTAPLNQLEDSLSEKQHNPETPNNKITSNQNNHDINTEKMAEVFISYSWDSDEHENRVGALTNYLRENGFNAQIDKMISQQETATNFVKMMHKAMLEHPKVIVVLSEGYKRKAENFTGGVGEEYQLLINDITANPRKYILFSFNGRSNEIIPFGLQGRDIIDFLATDSKEKLLRKLMDQDEYVFSEVAAEKPKLQPKQFGSFGPTVPSKTVGIEPPFVKWQDSRADQGKYRSISYKITPEFKNVSFGNVDGFNYEVKLRRELAPEFYEYADQDGNITIRGESTRKIFPGQKIKGQEIDVKIQSHLLHQILGSQIVVTVFTDSGMFSAEFPIEELFKVHPVNQSHLSPSPINRYMFH